MMITNHTYAAGMHEAAAEISTPGIAQKLRKTQVATGTNLKGIENLGSR